MVGSVGAELVTVPVRGANGNAYTADPQAGILTNSAPCTGPAKPPRALRRSAPPLSPSPPKYFVMRSAGIGQTVTRDSSRDTPPPRIQAVVSVAYDCERRFEKDLLQPV